MSCFYLSLVDQLAARHAIGRRHNASLDAEEQASRLFLISCDLISGFQSQNLCDYLEQMMSRTWPDVLRSEPSIRDKQATSPPSSAVLPTASIATLIAASGALVGFLWSQKTDVTSDSNAVSTEFSRSAWVDDVHERWQSYVLQLLTAHPPFSAEACSTACYTVGQLSLLPGGCCERVLHSACEALRAGREDGLTAILATELLGQCTSLMVVCRPFQLRGIALEDPALQRKRTPESSDKPKKGKAVAPSAQTGKFTCLSTWRPVVAVGGTPGASKGRGGVEVANESLAGAETAATEKDTCTEIPSCYPFPSTERLAQLKAELIECCLATLGASSITTTATSTVTANAQQGRTVPTALICQRVLIPLLLLDGSEGLQRYEELIHNLLHTLARRNGAAIPSTTIVNFTSKPTNTTSMGAVAQYHSDFLNDNSNCDDVVLLIAALFDFLFRQPSLYSAKDFRFSPFLWGILGGAMHRSITATEVDTGHRANMQLRVEYLLKRIVYLTKEEQYQQTAITATPLPPVIEFHPFFCWCTTLSESTGEALSAMAWDNFFLVLESLNEYGWHIIEPVMARLDTLIADLNTYLEGHMRVTKAAMTSGEKLSTQGALHTHWIEMLLLKLILHPNVGVRKVGLRRVWALPTGVLQALSATFLFQYTFQSASDPRLCADLDRIPITASFLDTKAFEGTEMKSVPDVEPLAQEVERFYSSLFLSRWSDNSMTAAAVTADSTRGRIDALCRLLDTALNKPPRFTVCVLARTLFAIGQVLLDHHINAEPILFDEGVLQRLHRFMRDSVQENIPFWLDVRVTAILFASLTTFAAATPSPRRCRGHLSFWRLYCMCGPLGESGGHSVTGMDACGQYGLVGAAVDERFLQQWLANLSAQMQKKKKEANSDSTSAALSFVEELLDVAGLEGRVGRLLQASASISSTFVMNVAEIKETFFLVGTLARTGSARNALLLKQLGHTIASTVASLETRAYCAPAHLLTSAACLVEFYHTVGDEACAQLWPLRTTLQSMSAALHTHAVTSLTAALEAIYSESSSDMSNSNNVVDDVSLFEDDAVWTLMNTTHFDILAAAIASVNAVACSSWCGGNVNGGASEANHQAEAANVAFANTAAGEALGAVEHIRQLMFLVRETAKTYQTLTSASKRSNGGDANEVRVSAALVLTRNAYRLLQSELCGFLAVKQNFTDVSREHDNTASGLHPSPLPTYRESFSSAASMRCPLGLTLPPQAVQSYLHELMSSPAYRVPTGSVPSVLSDMPWSTLLGQHGRYRCNILYVLALCLCPASQENRPGISCVESQFMTSQAGYEQTVASVQDFALEQLEECWTMNLASVYDLLVWVASTNLSPHVVNYLAIVDGMWDHMKEVGARQFTRLAALAFTVLHFVMPHYPTYVRDLLLRVLEGEGKEAQTADRDVYFAAMTASLQVLHDPTHNWPVLREVLLYAAVLFNTNRDEEENESTVAVTEPLLWSWPDAVRTYYPPTTRMSAVGRAIAVATLLWICQADVVGRAVPLTLELLRMNACHPVVTHEPCMPNSRTHRTRIRLWQLLCALLPCLAQPEQPVPLSQIEEVFRLLVFHCMTVNNMGSVRRLMELYAIRLVEQHPGLYTVVSEVLGNYSLRPQVCGSYILIACHALLRQEDRHTIAGEVAAVPTVVGEGDGTFDSLFPRILQQCTSNQHLLRIISHIGLVNICQRRIAHNRPLSRAVTAIYDYVLNAPEHIKFREKHEHMLFFDTDEASSPRNLFCVQRKEANTVLAEVLPAAVFERIRFIETEVCCMIGVMYPMELLRVHDWCAALRVRDLVAVFKDFALIPHTDTPCDYYVDYTQEATELLTRYPMLEAGAGVGSAEAAGETINAATANVQKKVSSWWTGEVYNELHPRALRTRKQPVIVVGSLLENPVNIAGLCRCGEIFAVESIVVPEKKVFEHPHFVAAARSAELWIPWEEVMPKDLPGYLESLRRRGYTVVGIEQTANSVSIETFSFPERCAVVLGAEGQGVPAPLIPLLDVCVEIPQYGLIRSLNVHVTGAIAMYEYTRQHLMSKQQ